jgi:hypothetical protein
MSIKEKLKRGMKKGKKLSGLFLAFALVILVSSIYPFKIRIPLSNATPASPLPAMNNTNSNTKSWHLARAIF